ncbi:MAG: acylase [Acaryochloris sp. RU_4_1]|nr:acylase [Acaryochloris sp. RU_4_1]NJR53704.1 acylase [Acaryochloris sp. CRU_2_0]
MKCSQILNTHKRIQQFLLMLSCAAILCIGIYPSTAAPKSTEILWDSAGVPHIYGKTVPDLFRAFGWAQAKSHGNLILRLYGESRGRAAEYWGEDEVNTDRWVRTMGIPARAQTWYTAQTPEFRSYLDAFAAGINAYTQQHPDLIDDNVESVLPVQGVDVLAHLQHILHFTFMVNAEQIASLTGSQPSARVHARSTLGSNAWAIAPSRSASGHALLLANPHTPWSGALLWYEAQLTAPGIDAYGASFVGIPVLNIAFNDHLGWTHTVNTHDGWDAYELAVTGGKYRFDGKLHPFKVETQSLKIKQADGTLREEQLTIQHAIHGPVVAQTGNKAMTAGRSQTIALRVVGLDQPQALTQWWEMARAQNLTQFEAALKPLQIPMFSVLYADRAGHILHVFNGQVPIRIGGTFADWQGIVSGDTAKTLWTKTHAYESLPRVLDPPSGWLQNANDPPWTTTFPPVLRRDRYPAYMAPKGPMDFRPQRSARMLMADKQITFEEMIQYKHSTWMELADRLLDDLIPATQQYGNELARHAASVLAKWDRQANANSRGAVLFNFWLEAMDFDPQFAVPWTEASPQTTPDGLADPARAVVALERAAAQVETTYKALDIPWGEVFRLRYGKVDLPANGGYGDLGIFRTLDFDPVAGNRFQAVQGDAFVALIEFSNPVKAKVLNSYGNATQPNSPHLGDQLALFAQQELRPVLRSRQEIQDSLVLVEKL